MDIVVDKITNEKNRKIIDEFIRYYKYIYTSQDNLNKSPKEIYYKLQNIKKVINILSKYKKEITIDELPDVKKIKYIGEKTIKRIEDILKTGKITEIEDIQDKEKTIDELTKIYGIGSSKALKLYNQGIKSIDDLKNHTDELTFQQKIGLKYYKDINEKIPRIIILQFDIYVNKLINNFDKDYIIVICGSYRREKNYSSDIDILISHKKIKMINQCKSYLDNVINLLNNFIVDKLNIDYTNHFQGYASFKNLNIKSTDNFNTQKNIIKLDIITVPIESLFTAMLHFTGNGNFNEYLRGMAKKKNMKLNEYELKDNNNKKIIINSEYDVFKYLNITYLQPNERNF